MNVRTDTYYQTQFGRAYCCDSLNLLQELDTRSVDLVVTSPPFALQRKKSYGNVSSDEYWSWFKPFADQIYRILKPKGSFVLDIGGSWNKGQPTRSLYHFDLLLKLCRPTGKFHLAQEFYWYNPAKLPAPAEWVNIRRIRVKDSVNPIWWLSKSANPKASNRRVLTPYSKSMQDLLKSGYNKGERPSGHNVSDKWGKQNGGAIPGNVIIASNTGSRDKYMEACRRVGIRLHPARFVKAVPEFFIRFLTVEGNLVLDPFAGSNVVGEVSESLERNWMSAEIDERFVVGSAFRFNEVGEKLFSKKSHLFQEVSDNGSRNS